MDIVKLEDNDIQRVAQQLANIDPWRKLNYKKKALVQYLLNNDSFFSCYKIVDYGEIAGVFCIKQPWWKGIYIEVFAIFPQFQRRGLGAKAIYWLEERAEQIKLKNLWLLVSDFNQPAYQFYLNKGFIEIGRLEGLIEINSDELLLRKQLNI